MLKILFAVEASVTSRCQLLVFDGPAFTMSNTRKRAAEEAVPSKKKNKKRKANFQENDALDAELGINTLFSRMDSQLLADHLAQKLTRFGTDLSPVEISDLTISGAPLAFKAHCANHRSHLLTLRQPIPYKTPPRGRSPGHWTSSRIFSKSFPRTLRAS
jgi:hypothetical protein